MGEPWISVIIPTYNRRDLLRLVLASLARQTYPAGEFEVVVVDDGSSDDTVAMCEAMRGELPYTLRVIDQGRGGRSRTRNTGIREARGALAILLDSDVVVVPGFVEAHAKAHGITPGLPPAQWPGSRIIGHGPVIHTEDLEHPVDRKKLSDFSTAFFATANVSLAREHLLRAGLFDESFNEYGWEDLELGERLRRLGLRAASVPGAKGFHYAGRLRVADLDAILRKERERGHMAVLFYRKHPTRVVRWATWITPAAFWLDRLLTLGGWPHRPGLRAWLERLERKGSRLLLPLVVRILMYHEYVRGLEEGTGGHRVVGGRLVADPERKEG